MSSATANRWNLGWDEWLETLPAAKCDEAIALMSTFRDLGAPEPKSRVRSQVDEGTPRLARFVFLRDLWGAINTRADVDILDSHPQSARLIAAGGSGEDVAFLARVSAFEAIMDVIGLIDNGPADDLGGHLPGWCLVQTNENYRPTDLVVGGLHESFTSVDPSGRQAEDLLYE